MYRLVFQVFIPHVMGRFMDFSGTNSVAAVKESPVWGVYAQTTLLSPIHAFYKLGDGGRQKVNLLESIAFACKKFGKFSTPTWFYTAFVVILLPFPSLPSRRYFPE